MAIFQHLTKRQKQGKKVKTHTIAPHNKHPKGVYYYTNTDITI